MNSRTLIQYEIHAMKLTVHSSQYKMHNKTRRLFAALEVGQGVVEEGLIYFGSGVGHWIFQSFT